MRKNVGILDRIIRMTLGSVLVYLFITGGFTVLVTSLLIFLAMIFLSTGLFGVCPIYSLVDVSSKNQNE